MHALLPTVALLSLFVLLGCNSDNSGSSSAPDFNLAGFWEGTLTPEDGSTPDRFRATFKSEGASPDDGSISADFQFCRTAFVGTFCFSRPLRCPEAAPVLAGSLEGSRLTGNLRGNRLDWAVLDIDFSDGDTGLGTYEYVESAGTCLGEVGVISITRRVF